MIIENKNWRKRLLSFVLCFVMVMTMLPSAPIHAHATEATEPSTEATEPAPVCDCGTDDPAIHATTCAVYVAPENPVCSCAEACGVETQNFWCDVCGFDYAKCTGTDTAVVYAEEGYTYDAATNTYTVYTADGLFAVAELVNGGDYSANITLAADIVLNENLADQVTVAEDGTVSADASVRKWTPMGENVLGEYSGTFDGGGHTITGLYCVYNSYSSIGLIGILAEGATVKNVKIHDFCLEPDGGAVVGYNRGEVIGCSISGTGILGWATWYQCVGGVVGYNEGTVKDCTSSAAMTFRGMGCFGGIVGNNLTSQATVIGCSNNGTITAAGYSEMKVGGIAGQAEGTVSGCYNTGSIRAAVEDGSVQVGGIVGWMKGTVSGCYNTGTVSGEAMAEASEAYVGGIAGYAEGPVSGCYNTGNISGDATGDTTGDDPRAYVGGITSANNGPVSGCYNIGSIDSDTYSGSIAAFAYGTYADCFYLDGSVKSGSTEQSSADGITEKTSDQFASGEVGYLLNGDQSTITYRQTLGSDAAPSFTGGTVYRVGVTCTEGAEAYANTQSDLDHNYTDGKCTACGEDCDHSGSTHTAVTVNADGTHSYTCAVCSLTVTEDHTFTDGICTVCKAEEPAPVLDISKGSIELKDGVIVSGCDDQGNSYKNQPYSGVLTITGSSSSNTVTVSSGDHKIVLDDCVISSTQGAAFAVANGATVNLTLNGANALSSGANHAGLEVPGGATLVINGSGSLTAAGGKSAAGIGGGCGENGGTITINVGTVTATGGQYGSNNGGGAGIGSGANTSSQPITGGNITILGGKVTATGGAGSGQMGSGAGIGGGGGNGSAWAGIAGNITITGGTVIAAGGTTSNGAPTGFDIGRGGKISVKQPNTGTVTITGGNIKASTVFPTPKDTGSNTLSLVTITLENAEPDDKPYCLFDSDNNPIAYKISDSELLDNNKLYVYLPVTDDTPTVSSVVAGDYKYSKSAETWDGGSSSGYSATFTRGDTKYDYTDVREDSVVSSLRFTYRNAAFSDSNQLLGAFTYSNGNKASVTLEVTTADAGLDIHANNGSNSVSIPLGSSQNINITLLSVNEENLVVDQYVRVGTISVKMGDEVLAEVPVEVILVKVAPQVTPPTAKTPTYSGEAQELITAGKTEEKAEAMQYSLDNQNWSAAIPMGTDAGEYTVYYKVPGNLYFTEVAPASVKVSIQAKEVTAPTFEDIVVQSAEPIKIDFKLMDGDTEIPASEYTVSYSKNTTPGTATITVTDKAGGNYTVSGTATVAYCDHSGSTHTSATDLGDGTHSYTCTVCGAAVTGEHTGGAATCQTQAVCEVCEESYGELDPNNHEYEKNNGICCDTYQPVELNESGYYEISNAGQLFWFAQQVNVEGNREIKGVLTADIDLENRPWTPIGETGENNKNFRGVFDGRDHTIKGLYVEGGRAGLGFFGEVRTGTVKNFTIYGEVVVNTEVNYVGGVIGSICGLNGENDLERNGAVIQNITSFVNVTAKAHGIGMIGGFVGYANHQSLIEQCAWYGTFDAGIYRVDSGAGGFIGKIQENTSEVTIRNCGAYGTIKTNYAGDYNNTATIYMGGFLSFSNTNAKTTLENCLFAGKFERGENLTDQAFLGAFGTLRSVNAIKNCYYLGDDGLAAVHSDSNLKPGSDNVEITNVTGEQLKSGEIAYLLQEANEVWGQTIGTDAYPVLGGEKVYQVKNCKQEIVYSNTADQVSHDYVNGFCVNCDAYEPAVLNANGYYQISNAGQLYWFAAQVNGGNTAINGVLTANIVVNENVLTADGALNGDGSNFREWTPIGKDSKKYAGTFDGGNHTVSGLYFNNSNYYVGLFGYVSGGTVKNVGVLDSFLSAECYVGGVVGYSNSTGTVTNCYNTGTVSGGGSYNFVGGVVGFTNGTITNCYNTGNVSGSGDIVNVGGVVGFTNGTITNCYNIGNVSGSGDIVNVGGVVGFTNGTITNCYYDSTVYSGNAIGAGEGTSTNVLAKTTEEFASGEVAYLLNGDQTTITFKQTLGTDASPNFTGATVYQVHCGEETNTFYSNTNQSYDQHTYENGTCTVCGASQSIVSVEISWGAMEFTYTDGEWQPESHTYAEGEWTPDADGSNVITVKNNGNVAVNVIVTYANTLTEVEGSFTDESDNAITSPFALAVEEEKKIKLILTSKPSSTLDAQTLGSVTVTITLPEE